LSSGEIALLYRWYAFHPEPSPSADRFLNRSRFNITTGPLSGRLRTNASFSSFGPAYMAAIPLPCTAPAPGLSADAHVTVH
jgi:hypothetical protein